MQLARHAKEMGMRAILIKNHFAMTADRASLASEETDFPVYGGLALNLSVGGTHAIVDDIPSLMLVVEKFPWASTTQVTNDVEKALVALGPAVEGMKMDSSLFRPATYIDTATANMNMALLISGALVAAAMLVLLGSWRSALIGIVAITLEFFVPFLAEFPIREFLATLMIYIIGQGIADHGKEREIARQAGLWLEQEERK